MIIVVGETPGSPEGQTGNRLAELFDVPPEVLYRRVVWINLWPSAERGYDPLQVVEFIERAAQPGDAVILLGRAVAKAFGLRDGPLGRVDRSGGFGPVLQCVPHTSGRNRWYNDPGNVVETQDVLRPLWRAYS